MSFEEYFKAYEEKRSQAEQGLLRSPLMLVERLAFKLMYVLDAELVKLPEGKLGEAIGMMIVKLTNESLAFSGALRMGTLQAAWPHVRALIELRAAIHYIQHPKAQMAKKVEQFSEYELLARWQKWKRVKLQLERGEIDQETYDREQIISPQLIKDVTPERIESWKKLYNCKCEKGLLGRRQWHDGTISLLVKDADSGSGLQIIYDNACHPTHFSPLGHRLSGAGAPKMIGYDQKHAKRAIDMMVCLERQIMHELNTLMEDSLDKHFLEESSRVQEITQAWSNSAL